MRGNGISRATGIAVAAAIFGAICILGLSFISEAFAQSDGPICRPNTREGRASYRAQRAYLSINYPERLVRQIDLLPRCIYCMKTSRGFIIEAVYQGSDEIKSQQWSAIEEVRHLDLLGQGKITKFRIRYQGDDDCACCGGPKTSTAAWIDETSRYAPPSGITDVPPLPPARQFARTKGPRPPRPASAKCSECEPAAESRNTVARRLFEAKMRYLEAEYQQGLAEHEAKRWSERLQVLATIPSVGANKVGLSEAVTLAQKEFIAANNRSNEQKNAANDAKNQIATLTSSLAEADKALAACEASRCKPHVAERTEPAKRYSVGGNLKPPTLYSVGTLFKPQPASFTGPNIGFNGSGNFNTLGQQERFKMNNMVTNDFSDSGQALGFGFSAGYLFPTGNPNILAGISASLDVLNQDTNHTFFGGFFLGQTTGVSGSVNGQLGFVAAPNVLIYLEAGPSFTNITQKLNFSGPVDLGKPNGHGGEPRPRRRIPAVRLAGCRIPDGDYRPDQSYYSAGRDIRQCGIAWFHISQRERYYSGQGWYSCSVVA
jgi:opacity protein-like surface antigen